MTKTKQEQYGDVQGTYNESVAKHELIKITHKHIANVFKEYNLNSDDFLFEYYHYEEYHLYKNDGSFIQVPFRSFGAKTFYCIAWKATKKVVTEDMLSPEGEYEKFLMNMKG